MVQSGHTDHFSRPSLAATTRFVLTSKKSNNLLSDSSVEAASERVVWGEISKL